MSWLPLAAGACFTQPRDHSLACHVVRVLLTGDNIVEVYLRTTLREGQSGTFARNVQALIRIEEGEETASSTASRWMICSMCVCVCGSYLIEDTASNETAADATPLSFDESSAQPRRRLYSI